MSLGNTIHLRMTDVLDRKAAQMWEPERSMLRELRDATDRVTSLRQTGDKIPTSAALNTAARNEKNARGMSINKLHIVRATYVKKSLGAFSTGAAASGSMLSAFAPHGLVIDEARNSRKLAPSIQSYMLMPMVTCAAF
jgi:hypothetical protein